MLHELSIAWFLLPPLAIEVDSSIQGQLQGMVGHSSSQGWLQGMLVDSSPQGQLQEH